MVSSPERLRERADLVRLTVFLVVAAVVTFWVAAVTDEYRSGSTATYKAAFQDVSGLQTGDQVRAAGVRVGEVVDISVRPDSTVLVTFEVDESITLRNTTTATVEYRNLIGDRIVQLATSAQEDGRELPPGETIALANTASALDLDTLLNGFKPLFQALSPDDINQLSYEIVQVFQGEGGTLESLLGHTASVTKTLADRDEVISDLIVNLDDVLDRIADRDSELSDLIVTFKQLVKGLKQDRKPILDSLEQISALSEETASLVTGIRKPFTNDIKQLRRFADNINRNKGELDRALQVLPIKLEKVGRTAIYGSYFNFYLCHFQGRVRLPGGSSVPVDYNVGGARCDLG